MAGQRISRRKAMKLVAQGAAGVAASAALGPFVSRTGFAAEKKQIVISSWGGSFQRTLREVYFTPFTHETGIEVVEQTYGTQGLAKLKAQMDAGAAQIDLLDGPPFWIGVGREQGLTQPIDLSGIADPSSHLPAALNKWGYGYGTVSWGIAYSTQTYSKGGPAGWADFWDVKRYKGRRALFGPLVARHPEYALMADGVAPKDVNPLDDAKINRAFRKLEQVKPHVDIWFPTNAQAESLLRSGELDMSEFVNGRAFGMQDQGIPVEFQFNEAVMNLLTWVMAKGAPNHDNALKFLDFASQPQRQAEFARRLYYGPSNRKAFDYIKDDKVQRRLPTYHEHLPKQVLLDGVWWGDNLGKLKDRWLKLVSG